MHSKTNSENTQRRPLSLAMQIFIALILAVAAGLFMQNHADLASEYINVNFAKKLH